MESRHWLKRGFSCLLVASVSFASAFVTSQLVWANIGSVFHGSSGCHGDLVSHGGFFGKWMSDYRSTLSVVLVKALFLSSVSICCRSVREEERPQGLWWFHLQVRRRLQRRRCSAQVCLPVPGGTQFSFSIKYRSLLLGWTEQSSSHNSFVVCH